MSTYPTNYYGQQLDPNLPAQLPDTVTVSNKLRDALRSRPFPVLSYDADDDAFALVPNVFEHPKVSAWQETETFGEPHGQIVGKLRRVWVWRARLKFLQIVAGDQIFAELAASTIEFDRNLDANNRIDPALRAHLTDVTHNWRPDVSPETGSSFILRFEIRPY